MGEEAEWPRKQSLLKQTNRGGRTGVRAGVGEKEFVKGICRALRGCSPTAAVSDCFFLL